MGVTKNAAAAIRTSLKLKLILSVVTVVGLAVGAAPWRTIKLQERQLLQDTQEHLVALQELLKAVVGAQAPTGHLDELQRLIEVVAAHEDIKAVRIINTEGEIRFSGRAEERGKHLSAAELSRYHGLTDPVLVTREQGAMFHSLMQPVFNQPRCSPCHAAEQKVLGIIQISLSLEHLSGKVAALKRSAWVGTLIALGIIVFGLWMSFTYFVDQPLQGLVTVMAQAEKGDLSARAEAGNQDEVGELARHFNQMISRLDAAQRELERYHQGQLARADRLATIGEMAAAIAHEIRNPLTGISGALSVLSRDFPSDDPRREIVRQTHLLIERLNKSVEDILHYSRPSPPQLHPVQLEEIVGRALSLVEGEAGKARVRVVVQAGRDADGTSPTVNADPYQIQQVIMNLILNAIQATAAGGQIVLRTLLSEQDGASRCACIEVEDNGKGMTAEEMAKAFQPFFSTKAQGTGLGLAMAKQIVEGHQGRISLHSTPGKGTCVRVELPAYLPAPSQ